MAKEKRAKATDASMETKPKRKRDTDAERKPEAKRARKKKVKTLPAEDHRGEAAADKCKTKTSEGEEDVVPEMSAEEEKVLERKVKKLLKKAERSKAKGAAATAVKSEEATPPSAAELSLEYLKGWATDKKQWKFQKLRQTWLLQHMYDTEKVPDSYFRILLKYLAGLKGQAKDTTIEKAESLVKTCEEEKVKEDVETEGETEKGKEKGSNIDEKKKKKRIRQVLKTLS